MKQITLAPALAALACGSAAGAQAPAPEPAAAAFSIHDVRQAFVPLVALPLDTGQSSDPIWATGEKPASNIIARLTLRSVDSASVDSDVGQGAGKPLQLVRAIADDPVQYESASDLPRRKERIYCAAGSAVSAGEKRIFCLVDSNADGLFEGRANGIGELGDKAEQLSILGRTEPLPAPVRYRAGEPVEFKAVFTNCGKHHDRPRYMFSLAPEGGRQPTLTDIALGMATAPASVNPAQMRSELYMAGLRGGACVAAEKVRESEPLHPASLAKGAAVARLGELVIQVGAKESGAAVKLLGLRDPQRLYRIARGQVLLISQSTTEQQRALALGQKFDKPVVMTAGEIKAEQGPKAVGDVILTAGIRHGYMGVLTQQTKIRTLLSSRSLPAGTVLYGMPMSSRLVTTRYGVPTSSFASSAVPEPEDVHLTWCVPVEEEAKWTATCLPTQGGDRYTLLKGQRPAFEVRSLSYSANISTNEGPVPVEMKAVDFAKPLSYRFRIKEIGPGVVTVTRETLFGDSVVSTQDERVPRMKGETSGLIFSGGLLSFTEVEGAADKLLIRIEEPFKAGQATEMRSGILNAEAVRKKRGAATGAAEPAKGTD